MANGTFGTDLTFRERSGTAAALLKTYPDSEQGWIDRYDRLWCAYLSEPYSTDEIKTFHLFRALDDNNAELDVTRRTFALFKFVVETDVGGCLGGRVALELEDGTTDANDTVRAGELEAGEAVWKRSLVDERLEAWVRSTLVMGDYCLEAVRTEAVAPYRTTIVGYDARNVVLTYDQLTGTKLVKATIRAGFVDDDHVAGDGVTEDGARHTYRREVTAERIDVWIDGVHNETLSGPHGAGVVPVVHLQCIPFTEPDHGLPAAIGIDEAIRMADSLATQAKAILTRFANPIGYISGAKVPEGSAIQKFGRWFSGPADMKAAYLEPSGNMIQQLTEQLGLLLKHIEQTNPEFMFADNEANVSGESRAFKASAFENKIGGIRGRIFSALARIVGIAVAMDADKAYDPERKAFKIDAPPILPRNVAGEVETLLSVRDAMTPGDFVRHLQRLGMVGLHEDPDAYAAKVATAGTPAP
jgi:hypothetical protein